MSEDNKRNLIYFERPSMRELYDCMEDWQISNQKRLLSISIQKDNESFCCIALTNPTEVILTDSTGTPLAMAKANLSGSRYNLCVYNVNG